MATAKSKDQRVRFSFPRISGVDQFRELVHQFGGAELVSEHLHIAPELLATYLSGDLDPPYTLMLAVYWHGPFGLSQGFSESHWTHQYNYYKRMEAEDKVGRYRLFLARVAKEGLLDADRCMHLAHEAGIDDAWPDELEPQWLALADEASAAAKQAEREARRALRKGGAREKRRAALESWRANQQQACGQLGAAGGMPPAPPRAPLRGPGARIRSRTVWEQSTATEQQQSASEEPTCAV